MKTTIDTEILKSGEALEIAHVIPPDAENGGQIRPFLGHKPANYLAHIDAAFEGKCDGLETRFYVGLLDGEMVGNIMTVETGGIGILGHVHTRLNQLNGLFDHAAWTFIPQVTLPIFDAGRNRNNLRVSEAQRDIATAQYEKAVQSAFRDVADALAGRATLVDQLAAQQAETDAETERFKLSNMLFTNGVQSSLDLLDAQRSLFASQQLLVQAKLALLQNRIAVYRALGGGWVQAAGAAAS